MFGISKTKWSPRKTFSTRVNTHTIQPRLTLIWVGFLGVRFEVGGGKITPPPCLKLVRTVLET